MTLQGLKTRMLWRFIIALLFVVVICSSVVGTSRAQSIEVTVGQNSLTLDMNLALQENLTLALPIFNIVVTQSNTSSVYNAAVGPINSAIKSLVPAASVSSLVLHTETVNSTKTWTLIENYTVTVIGANTIKGSTVTANLSLVSMNFSKSVLMAGQELNAVGSTYILQPLNTISSQYSKLGYFINGHQTLSAVIPDQTTKAFWLLDFNWVPPVSTWANQSDILGQSTSWTYSQPGAPYNLTLAVPSPEGTTLKSFTALYTPSLSIIVPYTARLEGNTMSFDVPTSAELVMPVIATTSLVALVAAALFDRRITGILQIRRKKR